MEAVNLRLVFARVSFADIRFPRQKLCELALKACAVRIVDGLLRKESARGVMAAVGSFYHLNGVGFSKEINIVFLHNTDSTDRDAFSWDIGKALLGREGKVLGSCRQVCKAELLK